MTKKKKKKKKKKSKKEGKIKEQSQVPGSIVESFWAGEVPLKKNQNGDGLINQPTKLTDLQSDLYIYNRIGREARVKNERKRKERD